MIRRLLRWTIRFALLVAAVSLVRAVLETRRPRIAAPESAWPPITPAMTPPDVRPTVAPGENIETTDAVQAVELVGDAGAPTAPSSDSSPWVEPVEGACPTSHPVKGKQRSGLYHEPGMVVYERTKADRCYLDAAAAEADGLTRAKH